MLTRNWSILPHILIPFRTDVLSILKTARFFHPPPCIKSIYVRGIVFTIIIILKANFFSNYHWNEMMMIHINFDLMNLPRDTTLRSPISIGRGMPSSFPDVLRSPSSEILVSSFPFSKSTRQLFCCFNISSGSFCSLRYLFNRKCLLRIQTI